MGERRQRYGVTVPRALTGGVANLAASVTHPLHSRAGRRPEEEEEDLRRREFLYGEPPDTIQEGTKRVLGWLSEVATARSKLAGPTIMVIEGNGSVGKTAIARRVYHHPSMVSSFQIRAWVNIGGTKRFASDVYQEIVEQILPSLEIERITSSNEKITLQKKAMGEYLQGKTCLVVLDALPAVPWSYVYNIMGRDADITLICTGCELKKFCRTSTFDISYLFSVHQEETRPRFYWRRALALASCPLHPVDLIITKCFPDAFALQMSLHLLYVNPKRSEGELISLNNLLKKNKNNIAKTMLMFCYSELPINYKSCLLYLSIFPKDHIIRRTSLLRRWIAEGLIAERSTTAREKDQVRSLEDQAELIFDALVTRGFVCPGETSSSGKVKSCTVHHIVHEFITTDVSLVDTCLPSHLAHRVSINNGIALQEVSDSNGPPDVTQTILESMPQSPQWQLLKVLDLEGCKGLKKRHLKNICKILLLKYLSLRDTDVTELPKQIEKLQCLETLDIRQTEIRVVSTKYFMLPRLKYFLAGHRISPNSTSDRFQESFEAVHLPSGIRRMKKIEVMSHVEVSDNVADLIDIGHLTQLRKLGVVLHNTKGVLNLLFQQIEKLQGCLRYLSIQINQQITTESYPDAEVVHALVNPPKLLESLSINGIKTVLPNWVADLDRLSKITLQDTSLGEDSIHILGNLRMLRCIKLMNKSYTENKLSFKVQEFQRLRFLVIEGTNISTVSFDNGAAPKLEMIVWSFSTLEALSGINHLPKLKKLELDGDCNLDPVKAAIEGHPNHPELNHNQ